MCVCVWGGTDPSAHYRRAGHRNPLELDSEKEGPEDCWCEIAKKKAPRLIPLLPCLAWKISKEAVRVTKDDGHLLGNEG